MTSSLSSSSSSLPESASAFPFGTVVVTSPSFSGDTASIATTASGTATGGGPLAHLASTLPPEVRVLGTSDPYGARCGSGGGTIAALDYAEAASAASAAASCEHANDGGKDTHATCTADHTTDPPSVLIVHAGGESSRCPTQMVLGKAWSSLPVAAASSSSSSSAGDECNNDQLQSSNTAPAAAAAAAAAPTPQNPTALLVSELSTLLRDLPRGSVVVAASDVLLGLPKGISFDFSATAGTTGTSSTSSSGTSHRSSSSSRDSVIGLAVPAPLHTAKNHGVYVLEPYLEHVHDDDRLNLSEHDGDGGGTCKDGGGDNGNGNDGAGDIGGESNCKDGTGSNDSGNMCKRRKVMAASDNAQEGIDAGASTDARQNMLRARTVTRFL